MTASQTICDRFDVSRESCERLEAFAALLATWQTRINLIGPSTAEAIWTRHIADSLQILALLAPKTTTVADLGSGAGFPGLILGIARPFAIHLFESNLKKAAFLREAIRRTGVNGSVHTMRIEAAGFIAEAVKPDAVTARALAPLPRLLALAEPFLRNGATGYFLKGQDVDAELTAASKTWRIHYEKYPSLTDSHGSVLVVKEAIRVA